MECTFKFAAYAVQSVLKSSSGMLTESECGWIVYYAVIDKCIYNKQYIGYGLWLSALI
jgi:hypothetical protein